MLFHTTTAKRGSEQATESFARNNWCKASHLRRSKDLSIMPGIVGLLIDSELFDGAISSESIFSKMTDRLSQRGALKKFQYDLSNGKIHLGILNTVVEPFYVEDHQHFRLLMIDKFEVHREGILDQVIDCLRDPKSRCELSNSTQMLVALGITKENQIRIFRSVDGVRPLYFAKLDYGFAFSTEQKAIWTVYPAETETLDPGWILSFTAGEERELIQVHSRTFSKFISRKRREDYLSVLRNRLEKSFMRLSQIGKCGVLFSGGVDSSLVALLTNSVSKNTLLISAATQDSKDFEKTKEAASSLSLEHKLFQFDDANIWEILPEVIYAIETSNRMDVEIAIPFFLAAKIAKEEGCKVLVSGQGPDELFAGYARYEKSYIENGAEKVREELWSDYSITHDANIARDVRAIEYFGLDSFFPYLDLEFSDSAFSAPIEFLLDPKGSPSRKIIFRELAKKMGLPEDIANAQKHATQYSSGSSKTLQKAVTKYVKDAREVSKKEASYLVQNVLDAIAQEIGIPGHYRLKTKLDMDMAPTYRLLERVGRLSSSNLG